MLSPITHLLQNRVTDVESWFDKKWDGKIPPIYFSCDIRHSGEKIGVVDTNLFPAGFNNLCNSFSNLASVAFNDYLDTYYPAAKKILILGEEHTRNKFYLKNLFKLQELLSKTGRETRVGMVGDFFTSSQLTVSLEADSLEIGKITRKGNRVGIENFEPDLILSNNDFSSGLLPLLEGIEQPVTPSPQAGWHQRLKSRHFEILWKLLGDFSKEFDLDSWILAPLTDTLPSLDFQNPETLKTASGKIDALINKIKTKYLEYKIKEPPYIFIKNNAGTYGMGIVTVSEGREIMTLNSRQRNKLFSTKGKPQWGKPQGGKGEAPGFLIQEGVPTADFYSDYPIEPVIYGIGKKDIGGFFRIHESKNEYESLNAPGMSFSCLCLHKLDEPHEDFFLNCRQKDKVVLVARFLARLSALATASEMNTV